jgi:hypothetical protein
MMVSCSRRPDSRTNTLNEKPVKQLSQVFVVVCIGNCLALLVKCEPVVQKQHDHTLNIVTRYKYTTFYKIL